MIVKNIRNDLMYKAMGMENENIIMVSNYLNEMLDFEYRIMYALISNFSLGIDTKYIYELMEPKGWTREILEGSIKYLISIGFIEDVKEDIDLDVMMLEIEELKRNTR